MSGQLAHAGEHELELAKSAALAGAGSVALAENGAGGKKRRKVPALVDGWRNLEQLRLQLGVLEDAIERRDFRAAQASAETVRTVEAGLAGAIERAEKERADAAALALLTRSAEALRPQVARAVELAPAPVRGLGVEIGDGETAARQEASWKAGLDGKQQREARAAHETFEAILDNRVNQQARAEKSLTAAAYLHHNMPLVRETLGDFFVAHLSSTGNPRLAFDPSPGAFAHGLLAALQPADASACVTTLRAWLAPAQLFDVVDRNRAVLEDGAADSVDYAKGPKGPAAWTPAVGAAIGAELLRNVMQALPRLAQRWLDASARAAALGKAIAPSLRTLAPATPLEQQVARAMLGEGGAPSVREVAASPKQVTASAAAGTAGADVLLQAVEAEAGQIATDLAVIRQLGEHGRGRMNYSKKLTGKSLQDRYSDVLGELAELRGHAMGGEPVEGARVKALRTTVAQLHTETDLVKKIALLAQTFATFDELTEDNWMIAGTLIESAANDLARRGMEPSVGELEGSGRLGSLEQVRRGAALLQGELSTVHSKWLKLQARLASLGGQEAAVARAEIETEMQTLRGHLAKLGSDAAVKAFLARAQKTAKNARYRAIFAQMAVMLGVSMLSAGLGAVAEGAALQSGAGAMTAMMASTTVEATAFSALSSQLNGTSLTHELTSNFLGNFVTFGAMRGTASLMARSRLGMQLAAGEAKGLTLVAAHAQALSAHVIVTAGVTYAQAQLESLAKQGRTLTLDEQVQLGIQGMAMMIGGAVLHHGMADTMTGLRADGAKMVDHGKLRAKLEAEVAAWQALDARSKARTQKQPTDGASPAEQLSPGKLHDMSLGLRLDSEAHHQGFSYDSKSHVMSLEGTKGGKNYRYQAQLPHPISSLADAQQNVLVGTKTFATFDEAQEILRAIGADDFASAGRRLEVTVPAGFSTKDGLEFGVGRLPDGQFVIVKGTQREVLWGELPGIVALSHSHSSTRGNDLPTNQHGSAEISLHELFADTKVPLEARELFLCSALDVQYTAEQAIARHVVVTPYVLEGQMVRKPTDASRDTARIEHIIEEPRDSGYRDRQGGKIYQATVEGRFKGEKIFGVQIFAVMDPPDPTAPHVPAQSGELRMSLPEGARRATVE